MTAPWKHGTLELKVLKALDVLPHKGFTQARGSKKEKEMKKFFVVVLVLGGIALCASSAPASPLYGEGLSGFLVIHQLSGIRGETFAQALHLVLCHW
jgi:hypothetical protein